jgi:hypothetical protein
VLLHSITATINAGGSDGYFRSLPCVSASMHFLFVSAQRFNYRFL